MSTRSWSECGYGYPLFNCENSSKIKEFIIKHRYSNDKLMADTIRNAADEYDLEDILGYPVVWIIAEIIRGLEDTNLVIGYQACGNTDTHAHIGFEPRFPWSMSEDDFRITEERATEILSKYAKELGITEKPTYFELEYFG